MDRTACTEPQCLYNDALYLLPLPYLVGIIFPPLGALAVAGVCHTYLELIPSQFLLLEYLVLLCISSDLPFCLIFMSFCVFRQS